MDFFVSSRAFSFKDVGRLDPSLVMWWLLYLSPLVVHHSFLLLLLVMIMMMLLLNFIDVIRLLTNWYVMNQVSGMFGANVSSCLARAVCPAVRSSSAHWQRHSAQWGHRGRRVSITPSLSDTVTDLNTTACEQVKFINPSEQWEL